MNNRVIGIAITLTISIILVGALLVPVIQDAEEGQQYTYVNKGYRADSVSGDVSFSWDSTNGVTLSDSSKIAPSSSTNGNMVVLAFDTGFIKLNYNGDIASFYAYNETLKYGSNISAMDVSIDYDTKTISLSNITATTTIEDTSFTYNSWCYVPSLDGDKVMYAPSALTADFYIEEDSTISGLFYNGATWMVSLDNDSEVSSYGSPTYTTALTKVATDYNGLSKLVGIKTASGSAYSVTVSSVEYYPAFIVLDRTATGTTDVGVSINPILATIPIIIIVALLAFAIRGVYRND